MAKQSALEKRIGDIENQWKRALADYRNLEKRVDKEKAAFIKLANATLIDKLLPVLDSLEKCGEHLKNKGLNFTLAQFKKVLESEEVKEARSLFFQLIHDFLRNFRPVIKECH